MTDQDLIGPSGRQRGGATRGVAILMATTFAAALVLVIAIAIIASSVVSSPGTIAQLRGPLIARVARGLVDIDTVLDGGSGAAAGTGMVLTRSGEVLTNNHVIQEATTIRATDLGNGQTYPARVVGYDESQDVAVLQLEGAAQLDSVSLGNSANVRIGARVGTIGNAGGVGGAPAARGGTVVALNRAIAVNDTFDDSVEHLSQLIEIHGDLEPGDSGGPMVDARGRVIGMDTAAATNFQFNVGSGADFAIEIDRVSRIAAQIVAGRGSATIHIGPTAFIGVDVNTIYTGPPGAAVAGVLVGTAAAGAGLRVGDLITRLGGRLVSSATGLSEALVPYSPGERVKLIWVDPAGLRHTAMIKLGTGPAA